MSQLALLDLLSACLTYEQRQVQVNQPARDSSSSSTGGTSARAQPCGRSQVSQPQQGRVARVPGGSLSSISSQCPVVLDAPTPCTL